MFGRVFLERLWAGLVSLGARRLAGLGLAGITVFALVGLSGYYLSRPDREIVYTGLDAQDVSRIGAALEEAGIPFDVNAEGNAVLVDYGKTAQARMLLAEKGLPKSDHSGYELFDNLGSLGLTSFMQEITRVRALEGEIARTIQLIKGVKAARVHIVLPKESSFRQAKANPSASVVVRTEGPDAGISAQAVRHLVAAAIPGMTADQVTVLDTDGTLMASGEDSVSAAPTKMVELEKEISRDIQEKISRTLSPYLGIDNFQISVAAKLNTDKKQISETTFDPESRVERSVRTIKESGEAQNVNSNAPVTVEQNVPTEATPSGTGDQSNEKKDRREELTNYEINTKSISTVSEGYMIDTLSIAVIVNRAKIAETLGGNPAPEALAVQLKEIELLAGSAAGIKEVRGDKVKVTAVDFLTSEKMLDPIPPPGIGEMVMRQLGAIINASALIVAVLLVLLLGLRPALKMIAAQGAPQLPSDPSVALAGMAPDATSVLPVNNALAAPEVNLVSDLSDRLQNQPQKRLEQIVELDTERAVKVFKQWLSQPKEGRA
jgi:flagellar M-ring protein FliF